MSTLVAADRDVLRKRLRELGHHGLRKFLDRTVLHPMEALQALSHGLETATRLGEFGKSMRRLERELQLSPARIETLITGYTGTFGQGALTAIDTLSGTRQRPARRAIPGLGTFWRPFATSDAQSLSDLYDARDALQALKSGVQLWRAGGRDGRAQEEIEKYRYLEPRAQAITDTATLFKRRFTPQISAIFADPKLTPSAKRQALDQIHEAMVDRARAALGRQPLPRRAESKAPVPVGPRASGSAR